jgi:hypothetical protein
VPSSRLHDHAGDDLGLVEHLAPNLEPGDVVVLADGREALVTARIEAEPEPLTPPLEVVIAPASEAPKGSPARYLEAELNVRRATRTVRRASADSRVRQPG